MGRIVRARSEEGSRIVRAGQLSAEARATKLLIEANRAREDAAKDLEEQVHSIALAVAKRILGEELTTNPERIGQLVGEAIKKVKRARELVVVLHPDDVPVIKRLAESIANRAERPLPFDIEEDPSLGRGDCLVRSNLGAVDARIETQLSAFEAALRAAARS